VQGFCFGYDPVTQHFGVKDVVACQIDDAFCGDFSVAKLTVDMDAAQARSRPLDIALVGSGPNAALSSRQWRIGMM
jgi:hypothetical protein